MIARVSAILRRPTTVAGAALLAVLLALFLAPEVLAFPYEQRFGATVVHAERPIDARLQAELARADQLLRASPVNDPQAPRRLFLTAGGWRWKLLSFGSDAFAFRRPFSSAILFNRSDTAADRIFNGRAVAGERTLSGVIAHETTHLLVARHIGEWRARFLPTWKQEGYADYVAQESSLSDADAAAMRARGEAAPALFYYDARRRVAAFLAARGGSVDALLE